MGDDANVAAHAHTLDSSGASSCLAVYVPFIDNSLQAARLFDVGVLLPVGLGRVGGRAELRRRVEDLVTILDSKAVDSSKDPGNMFLLGLGREGEAVDHAGELFVGKRGVVDDSAVG